MSPFRGGRFSLLSAGGGTSGGTSPAAAAKKMGLFAIILLGINGIIGSGAFLLPQQIYKDAGFVLGLATLLAAGVATLFIVFAYADLAGRVPGNGGAWLYSYEAFGRFTGFQVGLFVWFAGLATIATETSALIRIFKHSVPFLEHKSEWVLTSIGMVVIILLGVVNWFGGKLVQIVDNISSGVKIATAVFFVVLGAFAMKAANMKPYFPAGDTTIAKDLSALGSAYSVAFYLFAGFSFLTIAGSKMQNPGKNLPKALLIVITAVTATYLAIMFVTVGVLGEKTGESTTPVATAMQSAVGEWAYYLVIAGTAVAVFGVAFACSFEVPVLASSLATEHQLLPAFIGKKNKHGAPSAAILITSGLAALMLTTGSYVFLAKAVVAASAIQYVPTILAVIKLRNRPSAKGAFALKGVGRWIVVILALAATSYLFFSFNKLTLIISLVVFVLGVLLYIYDEKRRKDPSQAVKPGAELNEPVATRAGTPVIDRSQFPDRVRAAAKTGSQANSQAPSNGTNASGSSPDAPTQ